MNDKQEHLTLDWRSAVLAELHALDICNCGRKTPQAENHALDCPRKITNEIALLIPDDESAEIAQLQDLLSVQDKALAAQEAALESIGAGGVSALRTTAPQRMSDPDILRMISGMSAYEGDYETAIVRAVEKRMGPLTAATPAMWTDAEIAAGYVGIRWVTADGVFGRPTADDVRRYLAELGEIALAAEQEVIYMDAGHWRPAQDLPPR